MRRASCTKAGGKAVGRRYLQGSAALFLHCCLRDSRATPEASASAIVVIMVPYYMFICCNKSFAEPKGASSGARVVAGRQSIDRAEG